MKLSMNECRSVKIVKLQDKKNLSYREDNSKEIAILLPRNYSPTKKYRVLYAFDGQNIFSKGIKHPYRQEFGSWDCDIAIDSRNTPYDGIIIVGIFNGEGEYIRDSELTMSTAFGKLTALAEGEGFKNGHLDELGRFIVDSVIPYVENSFSVIQTANARGIFGSSSGGLASYYLGLKYPELFGTIGAFSPAISLFKQKTWLKFYSTLPLNNIFSDMYLYCGFGDSLEQLLIDGVKESAEVLRKNGYKGKIIERYENAQHNERAWKEFFPEFLDLFLKK